MSFVKGFYVIVSTFPIYRLKYNEICYTDGKN